jgi:hypothetical protein
LYIYKTSTKCETDASIFSFLTTVSEKKSGYTQHGIQQAQLARRVQDIIMHPPSRGFMNIVIRNFIRNCPVDCHHIQAADDIYGTNVGALKGKTPHCKVGHVTAIVDIVPPEILANHQNRQVTTVQDSLKQVIHKYQRQGFTIQTILGDNEFEPLVEIMHAHNFNLCGADEHVPDIERYIRTTKRYHSFCIQQLTIQTHPPCDSHSSG